MFLYMADQSYLVKIVIIMHNKCSQADLALSYVNRSKAELRTRTNLAHSNTPMAERKHPLGVGFTIHLLMA